ncbi:MAG: hypothetical protein WCF67_03960, partial [Chitinophagaceae bacterium]
VCHPLAAGRYTGVIYQNNNKVGEFAIRSDDKEEAPQADIDMSKYIGVKADNCDCEDKSDEYKIKSGGFAVFYSSGGESGFHAELFTSEKQKESKVYSTQKLLKGDVVVSMLMRPGAYEVTASNKSKLNLNVSVPKDYKNYERHLSTPNMVTLTGKGFAPASIDIMPAQGLVIKLEEDNDMDVKLVKAAPVPDEAVKLKPHRWVKPVRHEFKRKKK